MISQTTQELLERYTGKEVPYSFNGGYVCLSYAISLVGTGTTLELIRRRTSHRGMHNMSLLVGAAIAMGGIAIWSMHFIGNRAIDMLDGNETFQITYSTALTFTSLLVPILVLILAFLSISGNGKIRWWRIGLAGLLSGDAICGMHYLADSSITNYKSSYQLSYLIGSVVIAVFASTTTLALFFVFESSWKNAWWKRLGCAMVLAGAVSGMHWCAAAGTNYRLLKVTRREGMSRQDAMIVVICLAICGGIAMTGLAVYVSWVRRDYASKSQQVVLAACVFDKKGRIMVSQDGYLPSEVVTDTYLPKSNDDYFNTNHPFFHWMFLASRNWNTINTVMSKMVDHISLLAQSNNGRVSVKLVGEDGVLVEDYDTILRELFCVTANALADKTKETLNNVGVLWDEIFVTGESSRHVAPRHRVLNSDKFSLHSFAEKGDFQQHNAEDYGQGYLMFLVRTVNDKRDIEKLEASGYRFAEVHRAVSSIRSNMHIGTADLESRLRNMSNQKDKITMRTPRVHVGMFAVRARPDRGGFDVLAQKAAKDLLPSVAMPMDHLEPRHSEFLNCIRGMTLATILLKLEKQKMLGSPREMLFVSDLRDAVSGLRVLLDNELFDHATLLPREVQLPCSGNEGGEFQSKRTLIVFKFVVPIHTTIVSPQCEFTPLSLFKMRQLARERSAHVEFSHMVHRDISSVMHQMSPERPSIMSRLPTRYISGALEKVRDHLRGHERLGTLPPLSSARSQEQFSNLASHPSSIHRGEERSFEDVPQTSSASNYPAIKEPDGSSHKAQSQRKKFQVLGGIMVSQEVSINVQETQDKEQDFDSFEQDGTKPATLRSREGTEDQVENSYTATATGAIISAQGRKQKAAFVDELLALSVLADKRTQKQKLVLEIDHICDKLSY